MKPGNGAMQSMRSELPQPGCFSWAGVSSFWRALPFVGAVVLLIISRLGGAGQYACLNRASLAFFSVAEGMTGGLAFQLGTCLPESSPLLAGERGSLRWIQAALASVSTQAAAAALDDLTPRSLGGRMAYLLVGNAFLKSGEMDAAIASLQQAGALQRLVEAGNAAHDRGNDLQAFQFWQAARSAWREEGLHYKIERVVAVTALEGLARIWLQDKNYLLAAEAYAEKAEVIAPEVSLDTFISAGLLYFRAGDFVNSKRWYEIASEQFPSNPRPYFGLGQVLAAQEQWDPALTNFQIVVEMSPGNYEGWYWLGLAYAQLEHSPEACASWAQAIHLKPDYAAAQRQLETMGCTP
ncbi:MAG: tetratricopeptide repeat protein [Anaerolineales bacterium]|nr:tetratricopeptide repeat protein [Anaerolineales bacterium]